jgi:GNAT superfamily N-acetyltransferase
MQDGDFRARKPAIDVTRLDDGTTTAASSGSTIKTKSTAEMPEKLTVRRARRGEAGHLTALCLRSKRHWGYDEPFMRLAAMTLVVTEAAIAAGDVWVAATAGTDHALGVTALGGSGSELELQLLFVDPPAMGLGVGRLLFDVARQHLTSAGVDRMLILSDPNATGFYLRMGARPIGEAPSDAIPGRMLPLFEYRHRTDQRLA